jgi:uncharacterized membrane protein
MSQHYYPDPPKPLNSLAIVSFTLGITSYFALPVIGAIAAIITGYLGKQEMKANPDRYSGEGFATAGLILGYAHLALTLIIIVSIVIALVMLPSFVTWVTDLLK